MQKWFKSFLAKHGHVVAAACLVFCGISIVANGARLYFDMSLEPLYGFGSSVAGFLGLGAAIGYYKPAFREQRAQLTGALRMAPPSASKVLSFNGITTVPMNPDTILAAAVDKRIRHVIVAGWIDDPKGKSDLWLSGSSSDATENIFLIESAKKQMMELSQ